MHLSSITLANFRNYKNISLELAPGTTVLVGPNAQGKTNLLEAIFMLVLGKSFRTTDAHELIRYGSDFCRIDAQVQENEGSQRIELVVDARRADPMKQGKLSKRVKIEGVPHRLNSLICMFHAVLFVPDDLNVIVLSPSYRRSHLDTTLSQVSKEYAGALAQYGKVLRNRNKVLEGINEGTAGKSELTYWDEQIIHHATVLITHRAQLTDMYAETIPALYQKIAGERKKLGLTYLCCIESRTEVESKFTQKLAHTLDRDIAARTTTAGPHREDFSLTLDGHAVDSFGSRGEQRTAILALKLAEIEFIKQKTKKTPVLLLDDVFSELDETRREQLLHLAQPDQTIITTTDADAGMQTKGNVLNISEGVIQSALHDILRGVDTTIIREKDRI